MERVLGVQLDGLNKAYPFSRLKKQPQEFRDSIGSKSVSIHFDAKSETAYAADASGKPLASLVTFWFAWADFYPDTLILKASPPRSK
jgi:hypothetical protein